MHWANHDLLSLNTLPLKMAFMNAGSNVDPARTEKFYVNLPEYPTFFNDFYKQTSLKPEDVIGESHLPEGSVFGSRFKNLFIFRADPEILNSAAKNSNLEFFQKFTISLHTSDIHEFAREAGLRHFYVPPSQQKEGMNTFYVMGESNKIHEAVRKWEEEKGVDLNLELEDSQIHNESAAHEKGYELPLFKK